MKKGLFLRLDEEDIDDLKAMAKDLHNLDTPQQLLRKLIREHIRLYKEFKRDTAKLKRLQRSHSPNLGEEVKE